MNLFQLCAGRCVFVAAAVSQARPGCCFCTQWVVCVAIFEQDILYFARDFFWHAWISRA